MKISNTCALLAAVFATSMIACLSEPVSTGVTEQEVDTSVLFYENFFGDGGQCSGTVGVQSASMGTWTSNVTIDADSRPGGCSQQFAVADPENLLPGLALSVNFFADGDPGQCGSPGSRSIPVSSTPQFSSLYGIDTDGRSGGCWQVFSLSGRSDIVLDVEFLPTPGGDGGQCGSAGQRTVTTQTTQSFRIDTDNRSGGCTERFRLRRPFCGDGLCYNEDVSSCAADCSVCGDNLCTGPENAFTCGDCAVCDDGICSPGERFSCPSDCSTCGNGFCDFGEIDTCPSDCSCGRFGCEL
jgi:hypothetical protein